MKAPKKNSLFCCTWICGASLWLFLFPIILSGAVFTVVNTETAGPGSLAQAVSDANAQPGAEPQTVAFAIPGPGVHRIDLSNGGLGIGFSITIDGYTQPGASPNTLSVGDNAVILIQLDGGGPLGPGFGGLHISGTNCVVRGLSFTGFSGPDSSEAAISIGTNFGVPESGHQNRVEGNFIGLAPDGVTLSGNNYGIWVGTLGSDNFIGGNIPAARNVIAGNRTGIFSPFAVTVAGNYLGTDASGLRQGYGNGTAIVNSFNGVIGTGELGSGNVITGNDVGIRTDAHDVIIRGNLIGPYADGSPSFGNGAGIITAGGAAVGGLEPGESNVIAFNDTGVQVFGDSNSILSNRFFRNGVIDIDLAGNGRTPNDFGDRDTGANNLQNFPVIASVVRNVGETVVSGGLNSTAATAFTLQFFANGPVAAPNQTLLGTKTVTTNSVGDASFQFSFPVATSPDEFITATATDPNGNTSEFFSPNGLVEFANISTRGNVGTGDKILIGGLILSSGSSRSLLVRALGPSLNVPGALVNPKIEVRAFDGALLAGNDNWRDSQQQEISATGLAPTDSQEAAVIFYQTSGQSYTVQVSGVNGTTGIATVEVYALGNTTTSLFGPKKFRNISTRGNVGTGDNVLIGGTIIQGSAAQKVLLRAIGPDLAGAGVPGSLQDPTLELRDAEGTLLLANDDWRSNQEQEIIATGLAPQDNRDSAILTTLLPTNYTAIVRGKNGATGIALVEIYALD